MLGNSIDNKVNHYGYIYCTTNNINGMKYIGQHRSNPATDNAYIGSGRKISEAIKQFGKKNFTKEILYYAENQEELDELERKTINEHNAVESDQYYNIAPGGFTHAQSEETRKKISESLKGIKKSEETRKKMSESKKRENLSEETIRLISESSRGRKLSDESKEKIRQARLGKHLSDEHKKHVGDALRGFKHSDISRKHMSEAQKGHPKYDGSGRALKKIMCVETGEVFESLHDADRKTGIDFRNLSAHLKGKVKSLKGLHFVLLN